MTQSNVIAAVEQGSESLPDALSWLLESASPWFPSPMATFIFGGEIWLLQPSPRIAIDPTQTSSPDAFPTW
jgi:hypothetical protein